MNKFLIALLVLVLASLACGQKAPEWQLRGWTVTPSLTPDARPTQTPVLVEITTTPLATQTPNLVIVSATPNPTSLCVSASVAVHLRPSPSTDNYPIEVLANGTRVTDLGGRSGVWYFVELGDNQGWVSGLYLGECP
jgi:hypothetical protein